MTLKEKLEEEIKKLEEEIKKLEEEINAKIGALAIIKLREEE